MRQRRKVTAPPPEPPTHLSPEAAAEWVRILSTEQGLDALHLDYSLLEAACTFAARWREAERRLAETGGAVVRGANGAAQQNPYVGVARAANRDYRDCLDKLGLTPLRRRKRKSDDDGVDLSILDLDAG